MKNFNLLQVLPELESGGVEQGTIDLANYLGQKNLVHLLCRMVVKWNLF